LYFADTEHVIELGLLVVAATCRLSLATSKSTGWMNQIINNAEQHRLLLIPTIIENNDLEPIDTAKV
jgi:hypothetical protein